MMCPAFMGPLGYLVLPFSYPCSQLVEQIDMISG